MGIFLVWFMKAISRQYSAKSEQLSFVIVPARAWVLFRCFCFGFL